MIIDIFKRTLVVHRQLIFKEILLYETYIASRYLIMQRRTYCLAHIGLEVNASSESFTNNESCHFQSANTLHCNCSKNTVLCLIAIICDLPSYATSTLYCIQSRIRSNISQPPRCPIWWSIDNKNSIKLTNVV